MDGVSLPRRVLAALLLTACAGLAPAWAAAASAARPSTAPAAGREPSTGWLPQGTQLVVKIRYADLKSSDLFRRLMTRRPLFSEEMAHVDAMVAAAGLDPSRDFERALIGTDGESRGQSVAVLTGPFDVKSLAAKLEQKGAKPVKDGAVTTYSIAAAPAAPTATGAGGRKAAPAGETVVAFPAPGLALAGTREWVRWAAGKVQGASGVAAAQAIDPLVRKLDDKASLGAAALGSVAVAKVESGYKKGDIDPGAFQGIKNLVASFHIANDLRVDSEATAASEDDADLLAMTIKGMIAIGGLKASLNDPDLADALHELHVTRTSDGVRITGRIPASIATRL